MPNDARTERLMERMMQEPTPAQIERVNRARVLAIRAVLEAMGCTHDGKECHHVHLIENLVIAAHKSTFVMLHMNPDTATVAFRAIPKQD